jgi:hypothetical protein
VTPTRSIAAGADQDQIPGSAGRNAKSRDDGDVSACFESDHRDATASPPGGTVFVASDPGWRKNSAWSGTRLRTVKRGRTVTVTSGAAASPTTSERTRDATYSSQWVHRRLTAAPRKGARGSFSARGASPSTSRVEGDHQLESAVLTRTSAETGSPAPADARCHASERPNIATPGTLAFDRRADAAESVRRSGVGRGGDVGPATLTSTGGFSGDTARSELCLNTAVAGDEDAGRAPSARSRFARTRPSGL